MRLPTIIRLCLGILLIVMLGFTGCGEDEKVTLVILEFRVPAELQGDQFSITIQPEGFEAWDPVMLPAEAGDPLPEVGTLTVIFPDQIAKAQIPVHFSVDLLWQGNIISSATTTADTIALHKTTRVVVVFSACGTQGAFCDGTDLPCNVHCRSREKRD